MKNITRIMDDAKALHQQTGKNVYIWILPGVEYAVETTATARREPWAFCWDGDRLIPNQLERW